MRVRLHMVARARSGDKGDASNVGLIADSPEIYELLLRQATAERVKEHFGALCRGPVERFEVPNLRALNFILHDSLGGGGTESLKTDAQGKTHAQGLLMMEVEVPEALLRGPLPAAVATAAAGALR
ncbi:MAG TPA: hypothetical protein VHR45_11765 [Thermoanaerobaculia bacterium]|nr:hypothetical protein [Thermoanaerobaculia bacterium]